MDNEMTWRLLRRLSMIIVDYIQLRLREYDESVGMVKHLHYLIVEFKKDFAV